MGVVSAAASGERQSLIDIINVLRAEVEALRAKVPTLVGTLAVADPGSQADGATVVSAAKTITGAALGDLVVVSMDIDPQGCILTAYVSAADTVKAVLQNESGGAIDFAAYNLRFMVIPKASVVSALPSQVITA